MLLGQIVNDCIGAALAQPIIEAFRAVGRSETTHLKHKPMLALGSRCDLIKRSLAIGCKHSASNFEVDGCAILLLIIVKRRYSIVGFVDSFYSDLCSLLGRRRPAFGE